MDTDAKNKRQNEKAEDELIRHLLLQAEAEEYREVLAKAPPAPRHSRAYRRWGETVSARPRFCPGGNGQITSPIVPGSLSGRRQVFCWSLSVLSC